MVIYKIAKIVFILSLLKNIAIFFYNISDLLFWKCAIAWNFSRNVTIITNEHSRKMKKMNVDEVKGESAITSL